MTPLTCSRSDDSMNSTTSSMLRDAPQQQKMEPAEAAAYAGKLVLVYSAKCQAVGR